MPRAKRIHYEGAVYHVTSRGNERRKIVFDDSDRCLFLKILAEVVEEHHLHCHAWVLMDNHYHLLLETPAANLSMAMKHLNGLYTQRFNRKRDGLSRKITKNKAKIVFSYQDESRIKSIERLETRSSPAPANVLTESESNHFLPLVQPTRPKFHP